MRPKYAKYTACVGAFTCGFTLIEVLVALVIVGILAAIAYPSYVEAERKSRRAEGYAALLQLMQQEERFYSQYARYAAFSFSASDAQAKAFKWYSGSNPASSAYEIAAYACPEETIENCVVLVAKPGTDRVDKDFKDPVCGELKLNSIGIKSVSGAAERCWK